MKQKKRKTKGWFIHGPRFLMFSSLFWIFASRSSLFGIFASGRFKLSHVMVFYEAAAYKEKKPCDLERLNIAYQNIDLYDTSHCIHMWCWDAPDHKAYADNPAGLLNTQKRWSFALPGESLIYHHRGLCQFLKTDLFNEMGLIGSLSICVDMQFKNPMAGRKQRLRGRSHLRITCRKIPGYTMTSSNGNIFRVAGLLCGEFTGHRWVPRTKVSDAELCGFLWSASE